MINVTPTISNSESIDLVNLAEDKTALEVKGLRPLNEVNDVVPQSGATARTRAAWDPVVTSRLATFLRPDGDSSKTLGIWASEALKPAFIRRTKGD